MENNKLKLMDIARYFNPAWFAAIMGTAVIPLAISFADFPGKIFLVKFFFLFSIFLFFLALIPWTLRFFLYKAEVKKDFNHPIAGNFFPTMPISLIIISLDFLKFPELFFTTEVSIQIAFYLWLFGAIGIYILGFIILTHIFRHKEIEVHHANFGWYIPPVSKLIIPVAGFELAAKMPGTMELTFGLSIVSLGIGFFLFIFVGASVYHRYIYHELPMSQFASTFFIGISPTAIIAVIIFKMMHLFSHSKVLGINPDFFNTLGKLGIFVNWGFALWWFIMALIIILYYIRKIELPYALSWWAFTFPLGAQSVATGVTWKISGFASVYGLYIFTVSLMMILWTIVLIRTVRGIIAGNIFKPAH
jgi:C4-dicarboxylate transporter/malic acid transport protein